MKPACGKCLSRIPKKKFLQLLRNPAVEVRAVIELIPGTIHTLHVDREAIEEAIRGLEIQDLDEELAKGIVCYYDEGETDGVHDACLFLGNVCCCWEGLPEHEPD